MGSEWPLVTIGSVAEVFDGPHATPKKTDCGPVFLGISTLNRGRLNLSTTEHLSHEDYIKWTRRVVPRANDVVFSYETRLGEVAIIPENLQCCLGRRMALVRTDKSKLSPHYFLYYFLSDEFQEVIRERTVHGSTVDRLLLKEFPKFPVRLPPVEVQDGVVALLQVIDSRIDNLHQTNTTLEAIAQALFKSWFVDFDPVHAKAEGRDPEAMDTATAALFPSEFEQSELGLIPKGWRAGTLDDLSHLNAKSWSSKRHPDAVIYVDLSGVHENRIGTVKELPYSDAPSRARRSLWDGDTIVGTVRPGNRAFAYIHHPAANLTGSTGFAVLSPKDEASASFVYLAATRNDSIERLANLADGGAYPAVRPNVVSATPVVIPPASIITAFSRITAPMLHKIGESRNVEATLVELRDTLLPRLISGKLRLPEATSSEYEAVEA